MFQFINFISISQSFIYKFLYFFFNFTLFLPFKNTNLRY